MSRLDEVLEAQKAEKEREQARRCSPSVLQVLKAAQEDILENVAKGAYSPEDAGWLYSDAQRKLVIIDAEIVSRQKGVT